MKDARSNGRPAAESHVSLGRFTVASLIGVALLLVVYYVGRETGLLSSLQRTVVSMMAISLLVLSVRHILRRVYTVPRITRTVDAVAALLILSEGMHLLGKIVLPPGQPPFPLYITLMKHIEGVSLYVGLTLLVACFLLCIFETEAAKRRLVKESEELAREVSERRRAEEAAQRSEEKYRSILESIEDGYYEVDLRGDFTFFNTAECRILGYNSGELMGLNYRHYTDEENAKAVYDTFHEVFLTGEPAKAIDWAVTRKDGSTCFVETSISLMRDEKGEPIGFRGILRDVTDRRKAEEERLAFEAQMQQTQKLESLGVLAGGIAHDFNNLLAAIMGNAELALMDLSPVSPVRDNLISVEEAAKRAADLARQMLAYSGKGRFIVQAIDLGEVAKEIGHLLAASVSKKALLKYELAENLPAIEADVTQIRQLMMNFVTNASEALGDDTGTISISTGAMQCDRDYFRGTFLDENLPEGEYVFLEVADTGCGMDEETCAKIFDPFFSTKFTGRGLGLAAALGIVRGHKGAIRVYSESNRGTTVKVVFPALACRAKPVDGGPDPAEEWQASGLVLLVDDEEEVLTVGSRMLKKMGFSVLTAKDGREAVEVFKQRNTDIVCVLLDLTMPRMDGEEAFCELRGIRSDVPVILSSGYSEQDVMERFSGKGLAGFVPKPYQRATLAEKIRDVLEPRARRGDRFRVSREKVLLRSREYEVRARQSL